MVGGVGGPGGAGKPGGVAPGALEHGAGVAPDAPKVGETFGATRDAAAGKIEPASASPLEQLRSGQIDLPRYVELKVEAATKHLAGLLPPAEIERVQGELRDLIEQDPDVAALVKAAEIGR